MTDAKMKERLREVGSILSSVTSGPWKYDAEYGDYVYSAEGDIVAEIRGFGACLPMEKNGRYIALVSPDLMRYVLAKLRPLLEEAFTGANAIDGYRVLGRALGVEFHTDDVTKVFEVLLQRVVLLKQGFDDRVTVEAERDARPDISPEAAHAFMEMFGTAIARMGGTDTTDEDTEWGPITRALRAHARKANA
jgi:hypothetical protein